MKRILMFATALLVALALASCQFPAADPGNTGSSETGNGGGGTPWGDESGNRSVNVMFYNLKTTSVTVSVYGNSQTIEPSAVATFTVTIPSTQNIVTYYVSGQGITSNSGTIDISQSLVVTIR